MALQIKRKFILNDALDSSKLLLQNGQALRVISSGGEVRLIEIDANGKVLLKGEEAALKSQVVAEEQRASGVEAGLRADLTQEISDRQAQDAAKLAEAKAYADQKVADLVNSAPAVLDTLKELADAIGDDPNFAATVAGQVGQVSADLSAEESRALAAESALADDIAAEQARAESAEQDLQDQIDALSGGSGTSLTSIDGRVTTLEGKVSTLEGSGEGSVAKAEQDAKDHADAAVLVEKTRAEGAEAGLAEDIAAEEARAVEAEGMLASQISAEESARIAADTAEYQARVLAVSTEKTRAESAEAALQDEIDAEEARALAAEGALAADIEAEESARIAAVSAVEAAVEAEESARIAAVSAEESARIAADSALQSSLNTEKARIDAILLASDADKDSFAEIVSLINSVDTSSDQAFASYALSNDAALAAEVSAREAGDSAEQSARQAADTALQGEIDAEETRALAAEAELAADIAVLEASLTSISTASQAVVQAEAEARVAAVAGVQSSLDAEVARATAAEASLSASVTSEASARTAADATLQANIEAEAAARAAAITAEESARAAAVSAEQARAESAEAALDSRMDAMEAREFHKAKFVLTAADLAAGYIELAHSAMEKSIVASVGRLMIHEGAGEDFTVSVVAGKSRMTFVGNLVSPSEEELAAGDVIYVRYMA